MPEPEPLMSILVIRGPERHDALTSAPPPLPPAPPSPPGAELSTLNATLSKCVGEGPSSSPTPSTALVTVTSLSR